MLNRNHRRGQRGQMIPIIALAAVVLLGSTALAVDLSLQTNQRRDLQNLTDSSALAGTRDLFGTNGQTVTATDQANGVADAFNAIGLAMGWPSSWAAGKTSVACAGTCYAAAYQTYSFYVNSPPQGAGTNNPGFATALAGKVNDLQVIAQKVTTNALSGVIGFRTSTEGSQSVAYRFPAGVPFGFALYSNTFVTDGNNVETVSGDVYANRYIQPQSSGQAGFCTDGGGHIVFGTPQSGDAGYNAKTNPGQADTTDPKASPLGQVASPCASNTANGQVNQTATGTTCPSISGVTSTLTWNTVIAACVASPAINPPSLGTITMSPKTVVPACTAWSSAPATGPGLYEVTASACKGTPKYDLTFTSAMTLKGYTFILDPGASMGETFNGNPKAPTAMCGGQSLPAVIITPWYPGYPGTNTGTSPNDGRFVVYNDGSSAADSNDLIEVDGLNTLLDLSSGTLYMPKGTVNLLNNGSIAINSGQAIVGTWNVQSGFHCNPDISYNPGNVASEREYLQLVQ